MNELLPSALTSKNLSVITKPSRGGGGGGAVRHATTPNVVSTRAAAVGSARRREASDGFQVIRGFLLACPLPRPGASRTSKPRSAQRLQDSSPPNHPEPS